MILAATTSFGATEAAATTPADSVAAKGKALTAVMRTLVVLLNQLLKNPEFTLA